MPDLLLELFSEEIPARMQARAARDLERLLLDGLAAEGFQPGGGRGFATSRRLAALITGLPAAQPARTEERKGPRVGAPAAALDGFLKAAGLSRIEDAQIVEDKKGAFYVATSHREGRATPDVVGDLVPRIIREFPWPKSMRWGDGTLRWVRPLRRIFCTFDGEVVPFSVDGLESSDVTEGHPTLAPGPIQARSFDAYAERLQRAKVILDRDERAARILADARSLAQAQGLELIEDEGLLAEVAGLAEWPVARIGNFDAKFLSVPDEVLIASMRGHQKYFSLRDPATGRLAPRFICVTNIEPTDGGAAMLRGYERVLGARLSDAWFLYQQDLKTPLATHADKLRTVTFFEGLGTIADKMVRVEEMTSRLAVAVGAPIADAALAARLAKADLPTGMVGEFPELQGVMGRYYALAEGVAPAIADAIRDHYKPAGPNDRVPAAPVAMAVALAEKLVTLILFWSIDEKPTGTKDPFALRRMALGVIQIVLANGLRLPILQFIGDGPVQRDLLAFFQDRLTVFLRDQGFRHDHIAAVLAPAADDFVMVRRQLEALAGFLTTADGKDLIAGYKRAANILRAETKKGGADAASRVDPAVLSAPAEQRLHDALLAARAACGTALGSEDYTAAMRALAPLRAPIDAFFEEVTVNAPEAALRQNRLALLSLITATFDRVANFSTLEG